MSTTDIISLVVAIYGAICATAGFVIAGILGIIEYKRNLPQVKVRLDTLQMWNTNPRARSKLQKNYLSINVSNHGTRPVTITSFSFLNAQKHVLVLQDFIEPSFKLEDGESHNILIPVAALAEEKFLNNIKKIRVIDGVGKTWETKFTKKHKAWILNNV